jgi:SAM-dependent methyltransferase
MDDDTRRFYDLTAESVADVWYERDVLMPTIEDFVALLRDEPRILDLGCGPGHESMRMASVGAKVIGVDFSTECIRVARERCPRCRFEVMDFRQLDLGFGQFDGVFAAGSLIHIRPEEMPDVMQKVAGVLADGGCFMAIVRDGEGMRVSTRVVDGQELRRVVHLYSKEALVSAARPLRFVREGHLAPSLVDDGWRCYIFRLDQASWGARGGSND